MTNDSRDVADLVTRLYALLDERRYDELGSVYTDDVSLSFPSGEMRGLSDVIATARARGERYERVQHISTDLLVDVDGDAATVRTNHWAVHVHAGGRFEAGLVHHFDARRGADGWRLARGRADVVWRAGEDAPASA
jgi:ketosteroid isomerase-like protein